MTSKKEKNVVSADQVDVYEQARLGLGGLIGELCEAMETEDTSSYKRSGYEMIGAYYKAPAHTGELLLTLSVVLEDLLHKLEMTQESEHVSAVRDEYSMLKKDE
ncbi:hypothetical protein ACAF76_013210 [Brevibacillus sp. TJ4]|uniref:hypothetical protein n=1 Tax=Brevibacillus sp. TJ4 TaxID=3234853 RepID=UPI0037D8B1B5